MLKNHIKPNTIHCGDVLDILKTFPSNSIDLVVTSPPYNIKNSTGNGLKCGNGGKWPQAALIEGYDTYNDAMPYDQYVEWQRKCLESMMRVVSDNGAIFYNHKWRVQKGIIQDRHEIIDGFPVRQIIIWERNGGINFNPGYFLPTYEVIYLIAKPSFKLKKGASKIGDIWKIGQDQKNWHPAPFPVELASRCIGSTDATIVLDPFMGSGSTAIAAEQNGRKWVGIDISKEYCTKAKTRIKNAQKHECSQNITAWQ